MEDLRGLVNLMRICSRSQSILISYNASNYHVTACVVHLWSIRRAIGSDYILCLWQALCFGVSAKTVLLLQEHLVRHSCLSSFLCTNLFAPLGVRHLFASLCYLFTSLLQPLPPPHCCEEGHCRRSIPDNVVESYIFPLL